MARAVGEPTSFFFADARAGEPLSYEALQTRRKIAEQLAARRQNAYPKNVGEGIFSAADSLSGALQQKDLEGRLADYEKDYEKSVDRASGRTAEESPPSERYASLPPATATDAAAEPAPVSSETRNAITAAAIPLPPPRPVYDRNPQIAEMNADPTLRPRLLAMAKGEVGDDPARQRVQLETAFNRAAARNQPLSQILLDTGTNKRLGYYPPETFRRGQASEDVLAPVLRGSDEGGQALGFAPTGNASGGVASRGIASGRYGSAGRVGDETYVTQETPAQLARLEASRVPGTPVNILPQAAGGIESGPRTFGGPYTQASTRVAALGGGDGTETPYRNPVIPTDIVAAPPEVRAGTQVAQAGGIGTTPGPFAKPTPTPSAPPSGMLPARELPSERDPPPPLKTPKSPGEIDAIRQALRTLDPNRRNFWATQAGEYAKDREYNDKLNDETYKSQLEAHRTERRLSQEYAQTQPEKDFELQQKRAETDRKEKELAHFGPGGEAAARAVMVESSKNVAELPQAMKALRDAQALLDQGIYTGATTGAKSIGQQVGEFMGMSADPKLARRQEFNAALLLALGSYRKGVAGTGGQNPGELKALLEATAGDKHLEEKAIRGTIDRLVSLGLTDARTHQRVLGTYAGEDPNLRRIAYGGHSLPMEYVVPQASVDKFKQHFANDPDAAIERIDRFYHTPGLGRSILDSGR